VSVTPPPVASAGAAELRIPVLMPDGVRCSECVERLRSAVERMNGVHSVVVDTRTWTLAVTYDPQRATPAELDGAARRLGLEIGETLAHASYRLGGLD
jgi:copper chaperone CopZ